MYSEGEKAAIFGQQLDRLICVQQASESILQRITQANAWPPIACEVYRIASRGRAGRLYDMLGYDDSRDRHLEWVIDKRMVPVVLLEHM